MNEWEIAAVVLIAAMLPCVVLCARAGATHALAALELLASLTTTVLMLLSEALRRQPFIDLAIALALVSLVGGVVFARMMERDL